MILTCDNCQLNIDTSDEESSKKVYCLRIIEYPEEFRLDTEYDNNFSKEGLELEVLKQNYKFFLHDEQCFNEFTNKKLYEFSKRLGTL